MQTLPQPRALTQTQTPGCPLGAAFSQGYQAARQGQQIDDAIWLTTSGQFREGYAAGQIINKRLADGFGQCSDCGGNF